MDGNNFTRRYGVADFTLHTRVDSEGGDSSRRICAGNSINQLASSGGGRQGLDGRYRLARCRGSRKEHLRKQMFIPGIHMTEQPHIVTRPLEIVVFGYGQLRHVVDI